MSVLEALPRLAPAVMRHLIAYGELLCEETGDALRQFRRRAVGLAVAAAAGAMALLLGSVWAIAATWDTPYRLATVGSLCVAFAFVALVAVIYIRGLMAAGVPRPFERLHAEWRADMQQLVDLDPTLGPELGIAPSTETVRPRESP